MMILGGGGGGRDRPPPQKKIIISQKAVVCIEKVPFGQKSFWIFPYGLRLDFLIFYQGNRGKNQEKPKKNYKKLKT